ncbi:metallophosphoesterase [Paenibacillus sp. FSL L8-0436]|uniref:metallophosphoesterase n=1 Tax=Paenibacillus sp. FSL L8-0436 TaxID=2954686 RepID=UPI0031589F07
MVTGWVVIIMAALLLLMGIGAATMVVSAFKKNIIAEEISLGSLPAEFEGYRILFITDIHRRRLPKKLLDPLHGNVDAVFLGGDLTEKGSPINRLVDNMALVASLAPVYAVHGNHDYRANISLVDNIIRGSGATLLIDENITLERGNECLLLTGVDFPKKGGKKAYAPLAPVPESLSSCCRIILVHDPLWVSQQPSLPADLILAGHTHGGQVVLPLIRQRHTDPFYQQYNAGMYRLERKDRSGAFVQMLISRGFGTAHLPLRWGSPAEMHVLTLRKGREQLEQSG